MLYSPIQFSRMCSVLTLSQVPDHTRSHLAYSANDRTLPTLIRAMKPRLEGKGHSLPVNRNLLSSSRDFGCLPSLHIQCVPQAKGLLDWTMCPVAQSSPLLRLWWLFSPQRFLPVNPIYSWHWKHQPGPCLYFVWMNQPCPDHLYPFWDKDQDWYSFVLRPGSNLGAPWKVFKSWGSDFTFQWVTCEPSVYAAICQKCWASHPDHSLTLLPRMQGRVQKRLLENKSASLEDACWKLYWPLVSGPRKTVNTCKHFVTCQRPYTCQLPYFTLTEPWRAASQSSHFTGG